MARKQRHKEKYITWDKSKQKYVLRVPNFKKEYYEDLNEAVKVRNAYVMALESEEKKSNYSSNENLQDLQQSNSAIVNYNVEILNNSYNASGKGLKSTCYEIYKDIINVPCGTTVSKLKKNLSYGEGRLVITNHSGKPAGSGKIGTGWTIEVYYGNQKFIYYT